MQKNAAEVNAVEQHFTMKDFDIDEYLVASSKGHVIVHFDCGPFGEIQNSCRKTIR